ncbi:hypothetical protein PWT90_07597 [Aphanocladium album]|nr:hypothetical protein PWT90_07597 [Aphanocladium album]
MKFLSAISVTLAMATGMAAAMPTDMTPTAMTPEVNARAIEAANLADASALIYLARIEQKEVTGPLPLIISLIGKLLPGNLSGSLNNAVAELFKGGDFILNGPLDFIEQLLRLNIPGALRSGLNTVLGTLKSLPKDAVNIIGGGPKPKPKTP